MAIIDDFKARFPEFDSGIVDQYLPALSVEYKCYYGVVYNDDPCVTTPVLNLIAHLLTFEMKASTAPARNLSSRSANGLSTSFEALTDSSSSERSKFFSSTKYGQKFMMLTNSRFGGYIV